MSKNEYDDSTDILVPADELESPTLLAIEITEDDQPSRIDWLVEQVNKAIYLYPEIRMHLVRVLEAYGVLDLPDDLSKLWPADVRNAFMVMEAGDGVNCKITVSNGTLYGVSVAPQDESVWETQHIEHSADKPDPEVGDE